MQPAPSAPVPLSRTSSATSTFYTSDFGEDEDELKFEEGVDVVEAMDDDDADTVMQDDQRSFGYLTPATSFSSSNSPTPTPSFARAAPLSHTASFSTDSNIDELEVEELLSIDNGPVTEEEEAESWAFVEELRAVELERQKRASLTQEKIDHEASTSLQRHTHSPAIADVGSISAPLPGCSHPTTTPKKTRSGASKHRAYYYATVRHK